VAVYLEVRFAWPAHQFRPMGNEDDMDNGCIEGWKITGDGGGGSVQGDGGTEV
jgi:hypothetical protein